jgi:autotransporter-associated beta strand protein
VVLVANDYSELRVYVTKLTATNRLYCLMQNPAYRDQATCKGYYQASYVDYFLGNQMPPPPPPPVSNAKLVWHGDGTNVWDAATTANWFTNWFYVGNDNTNPASFTSGDTVLFDLTGSNNAAIALAGSLTPGDVRVHAPKNYTFNGGGSLDGVMGLTKAGAGKLFFNGTNNYSGKTLIGEGPFIVNGALPNSPVTVRGGVWLDGRLGGNGVVGSAVSIYEGAGVSPGQGTNSPGTLTLATNLSLAGRTLNDFDLSNDPTGTTNASDLLVVNGNLVLQGTNTLVIHLLNTNLATGGVYPLITYSGTLTGSLSNLTVSGLSGIPFAQSARQNYAAGEKLPLARDGFVDRRQRWQRVGLAQDGELAERRGERHVRAERRRAFRQPRRVQPHCESRRRPDRRERHRGQHKQLRLQRQRRPHRHDGVDENQFRHAHPQHRQQHLYWKNHDCRRHAGRFGIGRDWFSQPARQSARRADQFDFIRQQHAARHRRILHGSRPDIEFRHEHD